MSDYEIINILKQDIAKEDYRSFYRHIKDEKIFKLISVYVGNEISFCFERFLENIAKIHSA